MVMVMLLVQTVEFGPFQEALHHALFNIQAGQLSWPA
jgi:hypothetical protein